MASTLETRLGERGLEARVRLRSTGRFAGASFLSLWLCGWAVGECFAINALASMARAALTGGPPARDASSSVSVASAAFLLFWLTFWTLGGILALRQVLLLLWGEDRLSVGPEGLVLENRAVWFRRRRVIPREQVLDVVVEHDVLAVETPDRRIDALRCERTEELRELAGSLKQELGLSASPPRGALGLPRGWSEVVTPEGRKALVPAPGVRAMQARVLGVLALLAIAGALWSGSRATQGPGWVPLALVLGGLAVALVWGTVRLTSTRKEWCVEPGRLVLQRRDGVQVAEVFQARSLVLDTDKDGDGDPWFELKALGETLDPARKQRNTQRIVRRMKDVSTPRRLGAWLSDHAGVPLEDRTGTRAAVDLAALRAKLEEAGFLGKLASRALAGLQGERR